MLQISFPRHLDHLTLNSRLTRPLLLFWLPCCFWYSFTGSYDLSCLRWLVTPSISLCTPPASICNFHLAPWATLSAGYGTSCWRNLGCLIFKTATWWATRRLSLQSWVSFGVTTPVDSYKVLRTIVVMKVAVIRCLSTSVSNTALFPVILRTVTRSICCIVFWVPWSAVRVIVVTTLGAVVEMISSFILFWFIPRIATTRIRPLIIATRSMLVSTVVILVVCRLLLILVGRIRNALWFRERVLLVVDAQISL